MSTTEILAVVAFLTLVVERIAARATEQTRAEEWVRKTFAGLIEGLNRQHEECRRELADMRDLISSITPDPQVAE